MSNISEVGIDKKEYRIDWDQQILSHKQCVQSWGEEAGGHIWNNLVRNIEKFSNEDIHKIDNDGQS